MARLVDINAGSPEVTTFAACAEEPATGELLAEIDRIISIREGTRELLVELDKTISVYKELVKDGTFDEADVLSMLASKGETIHSELSQSVDKLIDAGKLDQAERIARYLLERFPDSISSWNGLRAVHLARGDLTQAEQTARYQLERFPERYDGWLSLAMVYRARADKPQAVECYRKVIGIIRAHPEHYSPEVESAFREAIHQFEANAT
jgi:tetratricopeptide (TPR) repeat protein